ncbi:MAG: hypothetical protein FH756_14905 [Firmicutes bacterium]|nr:hypothetical protein [Bacillota bacterium]
MKAASPYTSRFCGFSIARAGKQEPSPVASGGRGAFIWAVTSMLYDEHGHIVGAIEAIKDISNRKEMEQQLRYLSWQ